MAIQRQQQQLPVPGSGERWAMFFDFDGTLTEIVSHPAHVRVDPDLPATLEELRIACDGAVAVISGRRLPELDDFLAPAKLPAAGVHGIERRLADGSTVRLEYDTAGLDPVRQKLLALAGADPGLLLEDKGASLALHYRCAPQREAECRELMGELIAPIPGYQVLYGKMVVEAKPSVGNKGRAIEAFMSESPFAGRRPLFAGDDVTDEDGFDMVQRLGGISIKVGDGASRAMFRTSSVVTLLDWLHSLPARMRPRAGTSPN